jgi:sulfite dehydrogenase (cytochrome) subunit B
MRFIGFTIVVMWAAIAGTMTAGKPVLLKPGPGLETVKAKCGTCHSLDYIVMNSPFLSAAGWTAEVTKMIKAFDAPVSEADAKVIADYLARNYGV